MYDSSGAKGIDTVRVKINNLVEQQNDQTADKPQTKLDKKVNNELKELAEQATKNAQSEPPPSNEPLTRITPKVPNGSNKVSSNVANRESETVKEPINSNQELVQSSVIPPGDYGFTVSRIDGKSPTGDDRILDVDLSYSGQIVVTGDTWKFGPVSGSCTVTYVDFEGGPIRQDIDKPTKASIPIGTHILVVESEHTDSFYDYCYWPAGNQDNSEIFFGNHIIYTQENDCAARIAKGEVETDEFGGGKWTWDITLPSLFFADCVNNSAPTADDQSVTTTMNTPIDIILTASDPENNSLTFTILPGGPTHGTLTGTSFPMTYTPVQNYIGPDEFTFKVNDGFQDSNVATVSILVEPCPSPAKATSNAQTLAPVCQENHAPIAEGSWSSVPPTPPDKPFIGAKIKLDGSKSHDPDKDDEVVKWQWEKRSPSNDYVKDTLTDSYI